MSRAVPSVSRYASLRLARRFRHALHQAQRTGATGLTLRELVALHGQASIATLLLLYAGFCLLPVGGVGNVFGVALWLLSWRWARGRTDVALPARVADMRLSARWSTVALKALAYGYRRAARWLRPRWRGMQAGWTHPWWAGWIAVQAGVIFLPVPLGNTLPAFSLMALGLGRLLEDGVMHLASLVVGALGLVYMVSLGRVTWQLCLDAWGLLGAWLG